MAAVLVHRVLITSAAEARRVRDALTRAIRLAERTAGCYDVIVGGGVELGLHFKNDRLQPARRGPQGRPRP